MSQKDGFTRILQFFGSNCEISASPLVGGGAGVNADQRWLFLAAWSEQVTP